MKNKYKVYAGVFITVFTILTFFIGSALIALAGQGTSCPGASPGYDCITENPSISFGKPLAVLDGSLYGGTSFLWANLVLDIFFWAALSTLIWVVFRRLFLSSRKLKR